MTIDQEKVVEAIYCVFDSVNDTLPSDKQIVKGLDTALLDPQGAVDSLGLTMIIVALERQVQEDFGQKINLVDENTMSMETSPFLKVESLAQHIVRLLNEKTR